MTSSLVFANGDHADERPVVVVRRPIRTLDYVTVIQRSSTAKTQKGIDHPAEPELGLDKDGRWVLAYQRSARCDQFLAASVYHGRLSDTYLLPLVEMWEQL